MSDIVRKIGNKTIRVVSAGSEPMNFNDAEMDRRASAAVHAAIDKAKICKKPIAGYEVETKRAFLEYPDGSIKYVE